MSKYSPGPWKWDKNPDWGDVEYPRDASGNWVSLSPGASANRALIIVAPSLLEMLRELELDDGGKCPICYRNCSGLEEYVHAPDCRLAALLAPFKETP